MQYKTIAKEEVPPEVPAVTERSTLYNLFKSLPFEQAICIKCFSSSSLYDRKAMVSALSTKLRREEKFKLVYRTKEEPLSPKRQAAYERSKNKGAFRRNILLYVWKERLLD